MTFDAVVGILQGERIFDHRGCALSREQVEELKSETASLLNGLSPQLDNCRDDLLSGGFTAHPRLARLAYLKNKILLYDE